VFKVFALTGVEPHRQKLMCKGATLKVCHGFCACDCPGKCSDFENIFAKLNWQKYWRF
jgi:hypothetical protein